MFYEKEGNHITTIAFDGKIVAADGQTTCQDRITDTEASKIIDLRKYGIRLDSQKILYAACSGTVSHSQLFLRMLKSTSYNPLENYNLEASVLVFLENMMGIFGGTSIVFENIRPYCIGSGAGYAQAAMLAGADAIEAVKIACKLDCSSGGKVQWKRVYNEDK